MPDDHIGGANVAPRIVIEWPISNHRDAAHVRTTQGAAQRVTIGRRRPQRRRCSCLQQRKLWRSYSQPLARVAAPLRRKIWAVCETVARQKVHRLWVW